VAAPGGTDEGDAAAWGEGIGVDLREGGFIVLHRRIRSWPLWHFMSAEQRMVWVQILLDANWKDSEAWDGAERFVVKRGQMIHSENTIAASAGVSRKVVRTAIAKLITEGAVDRKPALGRAHGPHLLTVVNYSKYQDYSDEAGPQSGQERAKDGPSEGPARALSEQVEQEEPVEPKKTPAADAAWARCNEVWARVCVPAGYAAARGGSEQRKNAAARMKSRDWFSAFVAACDFLATDSFYRGENGRGWAATLGWMLEKGSRAEKLAERASAKPPNPKDDHDATYRRLLDEAERELAGPNQRNGGDDRGTVAGDSRPGDVPAAPKALPPALGELLGGGWASRGLQDGAPVEPLPQRGTLPAKGALRDS
jgi:hypothetical protein